MDVEDSISDEVAFEPKKELVHGRDCVSQIILHIQWSHLSYTICTSSPDIDTIFNCLTI